MQPSLWRDDCQIISTTQETERKGFQGTLHEFSPLHLSKETTNRQRPQVWIDMAVPETVDSNCLWLRSHETNRIRSHETNRTRSHETNRTSGHETNRTSSHETRGCTAACHPAPSRSDILTPNCEPECGPKWNRHAKVWNLHNEFKISLWLCY